MGTIKPIARKQSLAPPPQSIIMASTQKAVCATKQGAANEAFEIVDVEVPAVKAGTVLVNVKAAAINPVDWKLAYSNFLGMTYPWVSGCDGAGVGEGVEGVSVGDQVWAFTPLTGGEFGCFQDKALFDARLVAKVPEGYSFAESTTLGVGGLTAGVGLYYSLKVPQEGGQQGFFLVWGGSTAVGQFVIQLAAQAGFDVVCTASAKHHDKLKALGAAHCVDYHDDDVADQIKAIVGDGLMFAYDTVSSETAAICGSVLSTAGGAKLTFIAGGPAEGSVPDTVEVISTFVGAAPGDADLTAWLQEFLPVFVAKCSAGEIVANDVEELASLEAVLEGLVQSQTGQVSAVKLVLTLE